MKFDDLDQKMRVFETAHDHCVTPEMFMVVRLDGRGFTQLTKERHPFERPFDAKFGDLMVQTTDQLMTASGFRVVYGYTESDEISLCLHRDEVTFGRKVRKIVSVLAGEASARFSTLLGDIAVFDARVSQLPNIERVVDYFRWRSEDAHRNALNGYCYWRMRDEGQSARAASRALRGLSTADKNELLFARGINFNELPAWQRRGVGLYWQTFRKEARDPRTGEARQAERRRIHTELELPMKDAYSAFLRELLTSTHGLDRC